MFVFSFFSELWLNAAVDADAIARSIARRIASSAARRRVRARDVDARAGAPRVRV